MRSRRSSRDSRPSITVDESDDDERSPISPLRNSSRRSPAEDAPWILEKDKVSLLSEEPQELERESGGGDGEAEEAEDEEGANKEKMEDVRNYRRKRPRSAWACSLGTLAVTLTSAFILWSVLVSYRDLQCDAVGCRGKLVSPLYLKLKDFDTEHTRFASKYDLYLHRENGVDEDYPPQGVPVLFIPGNAGSYRQVRSIASEAARYFKDVVSKDPARSPGARNLDFFMANFNEDITAFHGQTLLDQAEYLNEAVSYILSLYHDSRKSTMNTDIPDPSSVIVFGHSMGGIVARTMLIMPNYQPNTINTIITMSAPHARPPVSFDKQIVKTYDDINNYWRKSFAEKWASDNPLWHVTLVSIAGGGLDNVVPSDYASISSLVPDTHGFTVFTSSTPDVWLGVDHLAILWCNQLIKVTAKAMLDIVDVTRAGQTKQRAERMRIMKKWFLTSMEEGTEKTLPHKETTTLLTLSDKSDSILPSGERLVLRSLGATPEPKAYLLPVPPSPSTGSSGTKFSLMTNQRLDGMRDAKLVVMFCSVFPPNAGHGAALFLLNLDLSGDGTGATKLVCKSAADDVIKLPASTKDSKHAFDAVEPFSYLEYKVEDILEHQFVAVIDQTETPTPGWAIAEFTGSKESSIRSDIGLRGMMQDGQHWNLRQDRPLVTDIHVPIIRSSLFAYKLKLSPQDCGPNEQLFTPLVRQYLTDPYESKFFVNVSDVDINLHGTAPFMPAAFRPNSRQGLSLQIWSDPTCNSEINVDVQVDYVGSLGRLVMRYRTIMAAFPLLIVALVLRKQFQKYDATGRFISFSDGMDLFISQSLPWVVVSLSFFAGAMCFAQDDPYQIPSPLGDRISADRGSIAPVGTSQDLLVGLQDPFFWFLAPMFAVVSVGIVVALNYAAMLLLHITTAVLTLIRKVASLRSNRRQAPSAPFSSSSPRRRILTTTTLLFFVATLIPYQFAYMVACIVQGATCVRALRYARENGYGERSGPSWDFYNYAHSVLVIMLWILPINLPVLVVWHHNLAVHWLTPFASHHNVLSVMPFILLVETLTTGNMIPRMATRTKHITSFLLLGLAAYSAIYGVSYAYRLHYLVNGLAAWFVVLHFSTTRPTVAGLIEILTDESEDGQKKRHQ